MIGTKVKGLYKKVEKSSNITSILQRLAHLQGSDYLYNQYGEGTDVSGEFKAVLSRVNMDRLVSFTNTYIEEIFYPITAGYYGTSKALSEGLSSAAADASGAGLRALAADEYDLVEDLLNPIISKHSTLDTAFSKILSSGALNPEADFDPVYYFEENEIFDIEPDFYYPLLITITPIILKRYYEYLYPYSDSSSNYVFYRDASANPIESNWSTQKLTEAFIAINVAMDIDFEDPSFAIIEEVFFINLVSKILGAFGATFMDLEGIPGVETWNKLVGVEDGSGVIRFGGLTISEVESNQSLNEYLNDPSGSFAFIKKNIAVLMAKEMKKMKEETLLENLEETLGDEPTEAQEAAALAESTEYQEALTNLNTAETALSDFFTNTFKLSADYQQLVGMANAMAGGEDDDED